MPTIPELYEFRSTYENAIKDVLETATGATVYVSGDDDERHVPFLTVDFDEGQATGHKYPLGGVYYDDIYKGTLTIAVFSNDRADTAHHTLVAKVKAAMIPGRGLFTTENLPYHQLADVRQKSANFAADEQEDRDVTVISFDTVHGIRAEGWAAVELYVLAALESGTTEGLEDGSNAALETLL